MSTLENASKTDEFYLACRNGDVKFVEEYLKTNSDPDRYESSVQSTPLHTASRYRRKEIVGLLLNHHCDRSQVDEHGNTAYEVAANDEIRRLYSRPIDPSGSYRFQDETIDGCFDIVKRPKESVSTPQQSKLKESRTMEGYGTDAEKRLEVGYATTSISMCQSRLGRFLADLFQDDTPMSIKTMGNRLQELIDDEITANNDPQSKKANDLLKKFLYDHDSGRIEYLIRLYTMETKFYHALKYNPIPLALPLYIASRTMKVRHFQGRSYRGAKINDEDIVLYQWAAQNPARLLQTRHFSSTSIECSVAEKFLTNVSKKNDHSEQKSALFIFNFPQQCDQTINLSRLSFEHPCLSEFEDEAEVLILPWTLFQVDSIQQDSSYIISLTNVLLPHQNMWSSLKWILTHLRGSLKRFHEHFPPPVERF